MLFTNIYKHHDNLFGQVNKIALTNNIQKKNDLLLSILIMHIIIIKYVTLY